MYDLSKEETNKQKNTKRKENWIWGDSGKMRSCRNTYGQKKQDFFWNVIKQTFVSCFLFFGIIFDQIYWGKETNIRTNKHTKMLSLNIVTHYTQKHPTPIHFTITLIQCSLWSSSNRQHLLKMSLHIHLCPWLCVLIISISLTSFLNWAATNFDLVFKIVGEIIWELHIHNLSQ